MHTYMADIPPDDGPKMFYFKREMAQLKFDHARMRRRTNAVMFGLPAAGLLLIAELLCGASLLVLPTLIAVSAVIAA